MDKAAWFEIIEWAVVALAVGLAAWYAIRRLRKKGADNCDSQCTGCPLAEKCADRNTHK